ncbi:MAG: Gfo/Idh/MocA family protein [Gemmatimonadaceae bacterium]
MTTPVRMAVVGAGAIAQLTHLPVLSRMRGVQLAALVDNDQVKARALADRFGIPDVFTDLEDALEYREFDAAIVATPNHLHEPHVLELIASRKDVFCERPLSLNARGVERILLAATRAGQKVLVGNNHRFRADVQAMERFIRGDELGRLTGVRAGAWQQRGHIEGWRLRRQESGGGALFEHGFPLLDLALWVADFPKPERVWANMHRSRGANAVEETALVVVECEGGLTVSIDLSWAYVGDEERWWFETLGQRGSTRLAPLRVVKELNGVPVNVTPTGASARESAFIQSYRAELSHLLAVLNGGIPYEPPTDQVIVHRVLEAAYKSAEDGKEVRF